MKKIAILGSTGSIGTQTLEVVRENGDIEVLGLAAGNNIKLLEQQIREFKPRVVAVWKEEKAKELRENIKDLDVKVVSGTALDTGATSVAFGTMATFTQNAANWSSADVPEPTSGLLLLLGVAGLALRRKQK